MSTQHKPWIGVDLDGTLAFYDGWRGVENIGEPIPAMVKTIKTVLAAGNVVKIFTARVAVDDTALPFIQAWCEKYLGVVLEVTCKKDFGMIQLYDDRVRQVIPNTGITMDEALLEAKSDREGFQKFFLEVADELEFSLGQGESVQESMSLLMEKIKALNRE